MTGHVFVDILSGTRFSFEMYRSNLELDVTDEIARQAISLQVAYDIIKSYLKVTAIKKTC